MISILLCEDNRDLCAGLRYDLEEEGYIVDIAYTAKAFLELYSMRTYDLIILDVGLPDGNGFELCRRIGNKTPVIFLTAHDLEAEQLEGFNAGADDYITKPFSMPVLRKRVEVISRRKIDVKMGLGYVYDDGFLIINFDTLESSVDDKSIIFSRIELKMLKYFMSNAAQLLTRSQLLENLWDSQGKFVDEHALTVNIARIRSKIEITGRKYIKTVYGMGYQWLGEKL